jgi:rRNA maturation RNase YbeY
MQIDITTLHAFAPVDEPAIRRYAHWIMQQVSALCPERGWQELSIVLTDDRIRTLNAEWFGRDTVTDVISFDYPEPTNPSAGTGEVIINLQQAVGEGNERGSPDHEFALYLAHGCHHLTGADDHTPEDKSAMLQLEKAWVESAKNQGVCGPFFITP